MGLIAKIVSQKVGKCIAKGHKMQFISHIYAYRSMDRGIVYGLTFRCSECGYRLTRDSTKAEEAALAILNDGEK